MTSLHRRHLALLVAVSSTWNYACGSSPARDSISSPEAVPVMLIDRTSTGPAPITNGWFTTGSKGARLQIDAPLAEHTRLTLPLRFPMPGEAVLYTGCSNEIVRIKTSTDDVSRIDWSYENPGNTVRIRRWITVGGVSKPHFGWTDDVLAWTAYYNRLKNENPLSSRTHRMEFEVRHGHCRFLLDGRLLHEWRPASGMHEQRPTLRLSAGAQLGTVQRQSLNPTYPHFHPVDISARCNRTSLSGRKLDPAALPAQGEEFVVEDVPFVLAMKRGDGVAHIDLAESWFREGTLAGYEEPSAGSFGGRWLGALSDNPTRFQFRIPNRPCTAIHLIAATETREQAIPRFTVQFYAPEAGFPVSFISPDVPLATAAPQGSAAWQVKAESGKPMTLWHVVVPVDPGQLTAFANQSVLEFELTKDVQTYRMYPDPSYYSTHAGGLPSSVQVFAVTAEYSPVAIDFQPDALGNLWTEPDTPSYTTTLTNGDSVKRSVRLSLTAESLDRQDQCQRDATVVLGPNEQKTVNFKLPIKQFGHYDLRLKAQISPGANPGRNASELVLQRSLARIRKREHALRPFDAPGFMFGYWDWRGGHGTPGELDELQLMGTIGMESMSRGLSRDPAAIALAQRYGIKSYWSCPDAIAGNYGANPEKALADLEKRWSEFVKLPPTPVHEPVFVHFFSEPGGLGTHGTLPEFYGEAETPDPAREKTFSNFHAAALASAKIAKRYQPNVKILLPWGDPCFAIPFLKKGDELTRLLDGTAIDIGFFDRLPEQQMHQCAIHRMHQFMSVWNKNKKQAPVMPTVEGPCFSPIMPGGLDRMQHADYVVRAALTLAAYGVNRQFSIGNVAGSSDYWGEQHYGGGLMSRLPELNPHPSLSAVATMIRQLRHMQFVKWLPTGSQSVFCLQFQDARNGDTLYVLWTIRGTREVTLSFDGQRRGELVDAMDNSHPLRTESGGFRFSIGTSPVYVQGAGDTVSVTLGQANYQDSAPAPHTKVLGLAAELLVSQEQDSDPDYVDSFPDAIRRFPATMKIDRIPATNDTQVLTALSIELPPSEKDVGVMPFYTTLKPRAPITIPGKAQALSLWVQAASDWGRVVYVLRDAKGEKWTSVGTKGEWNCDDTPGASYFNFDGWRRVRVELPASAPYDGFREAGTTWWGSSGGDGRVDLPLAIEKVFVERRAKIMYVNALVPVPPHPVLFGELAAEYAAAADMDETALKRQSVRMPTPPQSGKTSQTPIQRLASEGTLPAVAMTSVEPPTQGYDGTRAIFTFNQVEAASHYDIWISRYADGRDALMLGSRLKGPGMVSGFRANTDFYAFVVYTTKDGQQSKPSAPFKFKMANQFGMR